MRYILFSPRQMTVPDGIAEHQRIVQQKLGRCLIRLQQYERLLKTWVANQEVAGATTAQLDAHRAQRANNVATNTLGQLVGKLKGTVLVPEATSPHSDEDPTGATSSEIFVRSTYRIELSAEDFTAMELRLGELVGLRNQLVHHFIERFNIWDIDGCSAAATFLDEAFAVVDDELLRLKGWAETTGHAQATLAAFIASDGFQRLLAADEESETQPDFGTGSVVEQLKAYAANHGEDGWAKLAEAARAIAAASGAMPSTYGFASWPHLANASRQFELRRLLGDGPVIERTLYRTRTGKS